MEKRKAGRVAAAGAGLALAGAALFFSYERWKCPFRAITGLPCAGCGVTTAFRLLLRGDAAGAWHANPAVFFLIPWCLWAALLYIRRGAQAWKSRSLWIVLAAGLVMVWAGRITGMVLFP